MSEYYVACIPRRARVGDLLKFVHTVQERHDFFAILVSRCRPGTDLCFSLKSNTFFEVLDASGIKQNWVVYVESELRNTFA